jgi:hypothetical protein
MCNCEELPVNLLNPPAICYTLKKGLRHSLPQPGCHLPNSPSAGIIKLFSPLPSLVSDIPAGDGNVANLFLRCIAETSKQTTFEISSYVFQNNSVRSMFYVNPERAAILVLPSAGGCQQIPLWRQGSWGSLGMGRQSADFCIASADRTAFRAFFPRCIFSFSTVSF